MTAMRHMMGKTFYSYKLKMMKPVPVKMENYKENKLLFKIHLLKVTYDFLVKMHLTLLSFTWALFKNFKLHCVPRWKTDS